MPGGFDRRGCLAFSPRPVLHDAESLFRRGHVQGEEGLLRPGPPEQHDGLPRRRAADPTFGESTHPTPLGLELVLEGCQFTPESKDLDRRPLSQRSLVVGHVRFPNVRSILTPALGAVGNGPHTIEKVRGTRANRR